jgi:hypothetical protein
MINFIQPVYLESLNRDHNRGELEVDITIETKDEDSQCNHLGIISTAAINLWLKEIKCLQQMVIIMKSCFTERKLNITYEGITNN